MVLQWFYKLWLVHGTTSELKLFLTISCLLKKMNVLLILPPELVFLFGSTNRCSRDTG